MLYPQSRDALAAEPASGAFEAPPIDDLREAARLEAARGPREEVAEVSDHVVGKARVRLYKPSLDSPLPIIVHAHGGGFVFNDVEVHDAVSRRFANRSGMAVASVDYRQPPEHRFPAAVEDMDAVVSWLRVEGGALGVDSERMLAHGDSAGGNLALVAARRNPGAFRALAVLYPFIDAQMRHDSYTTEAPVNWNKAEAAWYWEQYASSPADYANPDFSPYDAPDVSGLPPTLVMSSEHDPLRDEAEHFAARVAEAGVPCVGVRYLGQLHGFWRHNEAYDAAEPLMRQVAGFFQQYV
ncbi:MAG: alpha/beta hydrolase [Marmoricola sp.]